MWDVNIDAANTKKIWKEYNFFLIYSITVFQA